MGKGRGDGFGKRKALFCLASAAFFAIMLPAPGTHADTSTGGGRAPIPSGGSGTRQQGAAPGTPAVTTSPVQVMPVQKKPIQINPALINALYRILLTTDMAAEEYELEVALKEASKWEWAVKQSLSAYQTHVSQCANKQYNTVDQKNAGCTGTDTLDQCSSKLFNHCVSSNKFLAPSFHEDRKSMLKAADRLENAMKAYKVKLKMIP